MKWFHARTIVEETAVSVAVDQLSGKFHRFDEAYEALKWLLARKAGEIDELHRNVDGETYALYRQAADDLAKTPAITIVYQYDDDEVNILAVKAECVEELDE